MSGGPGTAAARLRHRDLLGCVMAIDAEGPVLDATGWSDAYWRAAAGTLGAERLLGLAQAAADRGRLLLTDARRAQLQTVVMRAAARQLVREQLLGEVAALLERERIDWRVLKGTATARLCYSAPWERLSGDTDLLVEPGRYRDALEVLGELEGFTGEKPWPGRFSREAAKAQTLRVRGMELDVHHKVTAMNDLDGLPAECVFADPVALTLDSGLTVLAPNRSVLFVHAAMHLTTENVRLTTAADLGRMIAAGWPELAPMDAAVPSALRPFVHAGLERVSEWFPVPEPLLERWAPSRLARAATTLQLRHRRLGLAVNIARRPHALQRLGELVRPAVHSSRCSVQGRVHPDESR